MDPADLKFVSTLDAALKRKARDELNERNEEDRLVAVQTLRKWVQEQDWLTTPTDFAFLLRFLRVRKFSQLGARETIANYWESKIESPVWFLDVDPRDKAIQEYLKTSFYLCPRAKDKHGRRVAFLRLGKLNDLFKQKRKDVHNVFKVIFMVNDWLLRDEATQVNGICLVTDYTDVSLQLFTSGFSMDVGRKFFRFFGKSQPARLKMIHVYNEPSFYDAINAMIWPFLKPKTRERRHLHGKSLVKIYDDLGMSVLPSDYCPDDYEGPTAGSAEEITEAMVEDMTKPAVCDYLRDLSSNKYGVDPKKKKSISQNPAASFRQLKVD